MRRPSNALRRALDDLGEGIRSLLGTGQARPDLVGELLEGRRPRTPPLRPRPEGRRARRPRPFAKARLRLVD